MLCWLVVQCGICPQAFNFAFGVYVSVVMPTREYHVVTSTTATLLHTMLSRTLAVRTPFVYLKAARSFSASALVRHTKVTRCLCYTHAYIQLPSLQQCLSSAASCKGGGPWSCGGDWAAHVSAAQAESTDLPAGPVRYRWDPWGGC